jgi:hypothetical protein
MTEKEGGQYEKTQNQIDPYFADSSINLWLSYLHRIEGYHDVLSDGTRGFGRYN